jgi:hypothetical protein
MRAFVVSRLVFVDSGYLSRVLFKGPSAMRIWITLGLFLVFIAGYTAQKYLAAAPPAFSQPYLMTVLFIVLITAVIPFAVMWLLGGLVKPFPLFSLFTVVGCIGASALAFAGYWYFTISSFPNAPPVTALLPRGITPGVFMAAILILNRWLSARKAKAEA